MSHFKQTFSVPCLTRGRRIYLQGKVQNRGQKVAIYSGTAALFKSQYHSISEGPFLIY